MIFGISGAPGYGKTLLSTLLAIIWIEQGTPVFSNYRIKHPKVRLIDPQQFLDLKKPYECLTVLDEVYAWMDSRMSGTLRNRFMSYSVLQSRKRGTDIIYTSQLDSSVDSRLRNLTCLDIIAVKPTKVGFRYIFDTGTVRRLRTLPYERAAKFWRLFDTHEIVELA